MVQSAIWRAATTAIALATALFAAAVYLRGAEHDPLPATLAVEETTDALISIARPAATCPRSEVYTGEPVPRRRLHLVGMMASDDRNQSNAMISVDSSPASVFAVGDQVVEGIVLESVGQRTVTIRYVVPTETLELNDPPVEVVQSYQPGEIENAVAIEHETQLKHVQRLTNDDLGNAQLPPEVHHGGDGFYVIERDYLIAQLDAPETMQQARVRPNEEGGVTLRAIQPGSLFDHIGLRMGDVVEEFNELPVNSLLDLARVRTSINDAIELKVKVHRNGEPGYLIVHLE